MSFITQTITLSKSDHVIPDINNTRNPSFIFVQFELLGIAPNISEFGCMLHARRWVMKKREKGGTDREGHSGEKVEEVHAGSLLRH